MIKFRSKLVHVVAAAIALLTLGVTHGAVGCQFLDPGATFGSAPPAIAHTPPLDQKPATARDAMRMAAAPVLDEALNVKREMVDLRAEVRQAARDRAAAELARLRATQQLGAAAHQPGAQQLLVGLRYEANCVSYHDHGSAVAASGGVWAVVPMICLDVIA